MTTKKRPAKRPFSQDFSGNSQTDPSMQKGADVNVIVATYARQHGRSVHQPPQPAQFRDVPSHDYGEALRRIAEINSAFAELPVEEQEKHENSPELWLTALEAEYELFELVREPSGDESLDSDPPTTEDRESD